MKTTTTNSNKRNETFQTQVHICYGRRCVVARQGYYFGLDSPTSAGARLFGDHSETRPLHQRRSRNAESLRTRRMLCDGGRRGDRPRSGPLRTLYEPAHVEGQQRHDGPDLQERHREGAQGRVSGQDRAGHSPYHRRDQAPHPAAGAEEGLRRYHHRDRRYGGRHRVAAVHRVGAPAALLAGL